MTSFLKNKDTLHIVGEIVIISGVCIYFSRKIKALNNKVCILEQKLTEQQEVINKHEKIIDRLIEIIQGPPVQPPQRAPAPKYKPKAENPERVINKVKFTFPDIQEIEDEIEDEVDDDDDKLDEVRRDTDILDEIEEIGDDDLDSEIQEELDELQNPE